MVLFSQFIRNNCKKKNLFKLDFATFCVGISFVLGNFKDGEVAQPAGTN